LHVGKDIVYVNGFINKMTGEGLTIYT